MLYHFVMRRFFLVSILVLGTLFFALNGVEANPPAYSQKCLHGVNASGRVGRRNEWEMTISGSGFPANTTVYLESISQTKKGPIITSGNRDVDKILNNFGINAKFTSGAFTYIAGSAKMKSDASGNISGVTLSGKPTGVGIRETMVNFYGIYVAPPSQPNPTVPEGGAGGLQNGTFAMTGTGGTDSKKCAAVKWDPEGMVFDATTLVPMDGVTVTILTGDGKPLSQGADWQYNQDILNPVVTEDGKGYSFMVYAGEKDGDSRPYLLSISPPPTYRLVTNVQDINPSYTTKDPTKEGDQPLYGPLYLGPTPIIEYFGKVAHADVALKSDSQQTHCTLNTYDPSEQLPNDGVYVYTNDTGCPLTQVTASQNGTVLGHMYADIDGQYNMTFPDTGINQPIDITYQPTDLTQLNTNPLVRTIQTVLRFLAQKAFVFAQSTAPLQTVVMHTQPILTTVQGYARDATGTIIPHAVVNVNRADDDTSIITVYADTSGYFSIPSGELPHAPYYLTFVNPVTNTTNKVETSVFARQNNIVSSIGQHTASPNTLITKQNNPQNVSAPTTTETTSQGILQPTAGVVILIIVIIVLIIAAVITFFMIRKQQSVSPFP